MLDIIGGIGGKVGNIYLVIVVLRSFLEFYDVNVYKDYVELNIGRDFFEFWLDVG